MLFFIRIHCVCNNCRGPFVLALNKSWCPNHFTCSKCNSELVNMGFVELNGSIYCENDYESFFAPKCAKCRQAIIGVSKLKYFI